jgi:mono/diheme cytochrome c family protein
MRKNLKLVIVLSFIAFGFVGFVSKTFANLYSASGYKRYQSANTKDLYVRNCARCHGLDGRGQTNQGRKYNVPDLVEETKGASSAKITKIITNGRLDMPAFGKKLTKKQISVLASYVKKL